MFAVAQCGMMTLGYRARPCLVKGGLGLTGGQYTQVQCSTIKYSACIVQHTVLFCTVHRPGMFVTRTRAHCLVHVYSARAVQRSAWRGMPPTVNLMCTTLATLLVLRSLYSCAAVLQSIELTATRACVLCYEQYVRT